MSKIANLWDALGTTERFSGRTFRSTTIRPKAVTGSTVTAVNRVAAGSSGTLANWLVKRQSQFAEAQSRIEIANRAEDLVSNDPHAASAISGMTINISGTGFVLQSVPNSEILGLTKEQTRRLQAQAEWAWQVWCNEADTAGKLKFWQIQYLATWSMLCRGEYFRLPVMLKDATATGRTFSLSLQGVDPLRVYTPSDKMADPSFRDGIQMDKLGRPIRYWVEDPSDRKRYVSAGYATSSEFTAIRAMVAHRPGMLHGFIPKSDEAVRGESVLAPAMKFFKDLSDYLDFELVGAIVAASFPVFIEVKNPYAITGDLNANTEVEKQPRYYQEFTPGQVVYGNENEIPHILDSKRPGDTFAPFVERLLRAVGASIGMPYEVIARDFSKTNYSSARAALLEAHRVIQLYQKWLIDSLCQPCFEMVFEEAWLRGMIEIPKGAPDFYEGRIAYTRSKWVPPKRGHVDPVKEMDALINGKAAAILNLDTIAAEMGTDWESVLMQRAREQEFAEQLGVTLGDEPQNNQREGDDGSDDSEE